MTWLCKRAVNRRPDGLADIQEECRDMCHGIVASRLVGATFYAAVRADDGTVWALVVETIYDRNGADGDLWYRFVPETAGPAADGCPRNVLDALDPTDDPEAVAWRARCRERLARPATGRMRPGTVIRWRAGDGGPEAVLTKTRLAGRRKSVWMDPSGGVVPDGAVWAGRVTVVARA